MKRLAIGLMLSSLLGCAHYPDEDKALSRRIEAQVSLPKGASPVWKYVRYYTRSQVEPGVVQAVYERDGRPGVHWVLPDDMPIILDGGCGVVTFEYDTATRSARAMRCN